MASDPHSPSSLEAQLRNMILSNVTITQDQANQASPHRGNHQQNHEGRGGFPGARGRAREAWRSAPNPPTQTQAGDRPTAAATSPGVRGVMNNQSPQRGNRHRQPRSQAQPHPPGQGVAGGIQNESMALPNHRNFSPRLPRQPNQQEPLPGQGATGNGQTPKALQRSHNNRPRYVPFESLVPQYLPRQHNPHMQPQQQQQQQHMNQQPPENPRAQVEHLDHLAAHEIRKVEIEKTEIDEKEAFRKYLERVCKKTLADNYSGDIATIALVGFGSLASGFATTGSDMDLAIVPAWKDAARSHETEIDPDIPRLLEKAILDDKLGGRLLTRTRVPILKVCQYPTEELYTALFEERKKWDELPTEENSSLPLPSVDLAVELNPLPKPIGTTQNPKDSERSTNSMETSSQISNVPNQESSPTPTAASQDTNGPKNNKNEQRPHHDRPWAREKALGPLDFPKTGVGIQCDINFQNPLGIHNTHLLKCYSLCDPRVRPVILFVKSWAKRRKINSSYSGTLSSYGWVLMVLHYLVNIAQPPVCPNLQLSPHSNGQNTVIQGYSVRFWRNEKEIMDAARLGQLSQNTQSIGALLRGFFQYFASLGGGWSQWPRTPSFQWKNEVLSLRTPGGLRSKQDKGWTAARTTISNGKEVRHRYLFSIEDPFELDHNVARTVTHNGIVAIRDEFRRAWRILSAIGQGVQPEGGIFDEVIERPMPSPALTAKSKQEDDEQTAAVSTENAVGS